MSGGGARDLSPTTHRKGPLVTTVISERRMVSQCSSEGTATPTIPEAEPRPSLCMVSSPEAIHAKEVMERVSWGQRAHVTKETFDLRCRQDPAFVEALEAMTWLT